MDNGAHDSLQRGNADAKDEVVVISSRPSVKESDLTMLSDLAPRRSSEESISQPRCSHTTDNSTSANFKSEDDDDEEEEGGAAEEGRARGGLVIEDDVWTPDVEACFNEALIMYPPCGRRKIVIPDEPKLYGERVLYCIALRG